MCDYVLIGWFEYIENADGQKIMRACNKDDEGAFPVYDKDNK